MGLNLIRLLGRLTFWKGNVAGWLGGGLLGSGFLGFLLVEVGPTTGTAVVHVVEPDVTVAVGGVTFEIEGRRFAPLVVELSMGAHRLVMTRGGVVLDDEPFEIDGGDSVVLSAWDQTRPPGDGQGAGARDRPEPDRGEPGLKGHPDR
ncbi:hypothetical protein [Tautonia sociabilis]|uniref:Uncharacterized protein n=1 Tax=Tautonia sociabilis TaxID=2080755 RepID=A0A432MMN1_9BACT|nr:hypothetical protein [Tautonia sociabilis]RUL88704.1 hypothetical protein TsocGM_06095 [Tautonia sociabilis]